MSKNYNAYLKSPHWKETRQEALRLAKGQCAHCGATLLLEVHHKSYDRLGREDQSDLKVLCRFCHQGLHDRQSETNYRAILIIWGIAIVMSWLCTLCNIPFS